MSNVRRDEGGPAIPPSTRPGAKRSTDEPSARLDATILAAARAATARAKSAPTPPATRHWWTALATSGRSRRRRRAGIHDRADAASGGRCPGETFDSEQAIERALPGRSEGLPQQNAASATTAVGTDGGSRCGATRRRRGAPCRPPRPRRAEPRKVPRHATLRARGRRPMRRPSNDSARLHLLRPRRRRRRIGRCASRLCTAPAMRVRPPTRCRRSARRIPTRTNILPEALLPWAASVGEQPAQAKEPAGITP